MTYHLSDSIEIAGDNSAVNQEGNRRGCRQCSRGHSENFKRMAEDLNEEYGLNVQVKFNTNGMLKNDLPFFSRIKDFSKNVRGLLLPFYSCAFLMIAAGISTV